MNTKERVKADIKKSGHSVTEIERHYGWANATIQATLAAKKVSVEDFDAAFANIFPEKK